MIFVYDIDNYAKKMYDYCCTIFASVLTLPLNAKVDGIQKHQNVRHKIYATILSGIPRKA